MNGNAKNQLLELLKSLGCIEDCADFQSKPISPGSHRSTVVVRFPNGCTVQGTGEGRCSSDADIAPAQVVLEQLRKDYPDLLIDWEEINVEAQASDALIKLSVYLSPGLKV
jgi:hypothetical protein